MKSQKTCNLTKNSPDILQTGAAFKLKYANSKPRLVH